MASMTTTTVKVVLLVVILIVHTGPSKPEGPYRLVGLPRTALVTSTLTGTHPSVVLAPGGTVVVFARSTWSIYSLAMLRASASLIAVVLLVTAACSVVTKAVCVVVGDWADTVVDGVDPQPGARSHSVAATTA